VAKLTRDEQAFLEEFERMLREGGLHPALALLNERTPHRFTGVYLFDPPIARNVGLFDRENRSLEMRNDAPMRETYCSIMGETGRAFCTADTLHDERVADHPARESVQSYMGTPLRRATRVGGSLCHFDFVPREPADGDYPMLDQAARLIVDWLDGSDAWPASRRG